MTTREYGKLIRGKNINIFVIYYINEQTDTNLPVQTLPPAFSCKNCSITWILGVVSKQLRLLHGRVGDSTTSVNSLNPQMSELVEDAIASCLSDIFSTNCTNEAPIQLLHFLEGIVLGFCLLDTE